jgi:hypothetical protein
MLQSLRKTIILLEKEKVFSPEKGRRWSADSPLSFRFQIITS